jgi:hypothetical protein
MAIKIPSKNIYEISNPKIRDNVIDNVSVEQNIVSPNNEYEVSVYNKKVSTANKTPIDDDNKIANSNTFSQTGFGTTAVSISVSAVGYIEKQVVSVNIKIPVLKENKYISDLFIGLNKDGENNIKSNIYGYTQKGNAKAYYKEGNTFSDIELESPTETSKEGSIQIPKELSNEFNFTTGAPFGLVSKAEIELKDVGNLSEATFEVVTINNEQFFSLELTVLCDVTTLSLGGGGYQYSDIYYDGLITGEYVRYISKEAEITFYGNTIGIDLTDGSVTYGSGNKPHSLSGNELLQDSAKVSETPLTERLANNVLNQYGKGKETATLLCSISDYYDESGEKVIDTKTNKMSFRLHDKVIPYVYGENGEDKPMSKYQDGTAKVFEVVGSNIIYDGAVWQELTLIEENKQNT